MQINASTLLGWILLSPITNKLFVITAKSYVGIYNVIKMIADGTDSLNQPLQITVTVRAGGDEVKGTTVSTSSSSGASADWLYLILSSFLLA